MVKKATTKKDPKNNGQKDFLVVGLGASAGGVQALQDFFSMMPPNSGMAFVVVLHLSPEHESNLKQIIEAQTTMPVTLVIETHSVEPDNVYVISPNRQLEMVDGVIRSKEVGGERGPRVAIDVFFRTLADVYRRNAVCIVLSGTGTDGTLGLKAIKEANGFAIVQAPDDAEYDSMPRSAIATHLADWILPVHEMPKRLINFKNSSEKLHLTGGDDRKVAKEIQADESLREILTLLRVRTGHDFSNYKTPTLVRRIARHLQIHDLEDIPAYLEFLRDNPDEIQSLLKNLLINVTNFFRDKEAWIAFEKNIVPNLFVGKTGSDMIRIWSCGCASGEEAYSLAMLFSDYAYHLQDPPKIQIFATDVDEDAIAEAREHRYPQSIEADVSPERLKRFFVKEGKYYSIKKELREKILFAPHNVLRDPPFSKLDLVVCRNLLIYLNRDTQERVMEIFHFALAPNGYLFLGSSETAESMPQLFMTIDKKFRFYSRRPAQITQTNAPPKMPVVGRWEIRLPEIKPKKGARPFSLGEVHYKLLESFAPPSILVNQDFEIQYQSESAGRYLRFKGGEPSSNLLRLINPDLLPDLRAALFSVQREGKTAEFQNVHATIEDKDTTLSIIVRPVEIDDETSNFLLVLFDEHNKLALPKEEKKKKPARSPDKEEAMEAVVLRLEEELARTKENLRTTIEQHEISVEELKASNEELQAINEELRSTTEELETSKEELQSVNEELTTVNQELKEKIDETSRTNSDLQNLMASTEIATIFLDRTFRIKRYTPPVEKLFNITPLDIGRPLEHFTHKLDYQNLAHDAAEVLRNLKMIEREVRDKNNRTYLTRFVPYRTIDDRIEGVVLNFLDISDRKEAEKAVAEDLRDMQILRDLGAQVIAKDDIQALYDKILETAISLTRADAGTIQLYAQQNQELILLAYKNFNSEMTKRFAQVDASSFTSCGKALLSGERVFVDYDNKKAKDADGALKLHWEAGFFSGQLTPLVSRSGKPIGMVSTHWRKHYRPNERELRFLDLLARQAADLIERRMAEDALRESEAHLSAVFTEVKVGLSEISIDGKFLRVNDALCEMLGRPREELLTLGFADITFPEDIQKSLETVRRVQQTGEPLSVEKRYVRSNGEIIWASSTLSMLRLGSHQTPIILAVTIDLTERKRHEERILESEKRIRIAVEAAQMATWEWDFEKNQVFWNDRHFTLLGLKPKRSPVTPELFFRRVHPNDRERLNKELQKAIREKSVFESEYTIIRTDGATRWLSGYGQVTEESPNGKALRMCGVMFDITERKEAEEALRKSEEHLNLILESTKDYAIITYDLKGKITRWNAGAERIFGWTEKETRGQTTHLIFTPEDRAAMIPEKELMSTLENGRAEDERWHLRKDGSRFFASGVMQLLRDGELEGFVKICRDQTVKLEAEQTAIEREMLRRLVSAQEDERRRIARDIHDHFGQQLTALRLKLDAIKKAVGKPKEIEKYTDEAQKTAADLDANVDFIAWELRPASLDDLGLRATLANFVKEWSNHTGIEADFHANGLKRSRLNYEIETNLYRIAQEALNNIQKHAGAENVSVLLEKSANQVSLIIEDDGIGFDPEDKANRQKGLGLVGMAERAKICGGALAIESAKGKGTTVFARIPANKG